MNIKIFISCHKKFKTLQSEIFTPIEVGAELHSKKIEGIVHDNDAKDNISVKNKKYCELTAQYYAWKNVEADYYGFFHYRRYLSFASKNYCPGLKFRLIEDKYPQDLVEKYGWTDENVENVTKNYDVLVAKKIIHFGNKWAYGVPKTQNSKDLDFCFKYVEKKYPEMKNAIKKYGKSLMAYFFNMFVMKKEIFNEYCTWLFDILDAHEKEFNVDHYGVQAYRVSGFLAERLLGVYITYLKQNKKLKIKELQTVMLKNTAEKPVFNQPKNTCSVIIKTDRKNYNFSNITINSIIKNSSPTKNYQIFILSNKLTDWQKNKLKEYSLNNISIFIIEENNTEEFIKEKLNNFDKIIVFNKNAIVNCDLFEIINNFNYDNNSSIYGGYDLNKIIKFGKIRLKKQAKLLNKCQPFSAVSDDILIYNVKNLINQKEIKSEVLFKDFIYNFKVEKNLQKKLYKNAPHYIYDNYIIAKNNPKIIIFENKSNPIKNYETDFSQLFWNYAKSSNIYELVLYQFFRNRRDKSIL